MQMLPLPQEFVLWDTEYTSWKGSEERNWGNTGEYRELVQIGAIKVLENTLTEIDSFSVFIKPTLNPVLSDYFINLTNITQACVDKEGINFSEAAKLFGDWVGSIPCYAYGTDATVLDVNFKLNGIDNFFSNVDFYNIRPLFASVGVDTDTYQSGIVTEAFGKKSPHRGHNGLNDARTLLEGLKLIKAGVPVI